MNILFLLKSFGIGGVEIVSSVLANKFIMENHIVSFFIFTPDEATLKNAKSLNPKINVIYGDGWNSFSNNVRDLRKVFIERDIDLVVNQWGLPYQIIRTAKVASKGFKNIKIVSFHHNDPSTNGKIKDVEIQLEACTNFFKRMFLKAKLWGVKLVTSCSMRYVYNNSDKFLVLSPSYIEKLQHFIHKNDESKQGVITNPVTIDIDYTSTFRKDKEIIYCGRLDYNQKRVYRVLDVWRILQEKFPEWKLTLVGDGCERLNLENKTKQLGLRNISFEGFKNPIDYYKRASLLIMTSEYEGFPLVLAEAMGYGVIPCVYGSFSAVYDIITDNVNGLIIPKLNSFDSSSMADSMALIMNSPKTINQMSFEAIETSKKFSIDTIYNEWQKLFVELDLLK